MYSSCLRKKATLLMLCDIAIMVAARAVVHAMVAVYTSMAQNDMVTSNQFFKTLLYSLAFHGIL